MNIYFNERFIYIFTILIIVILSFPRIKRYYYYWIERKFRYNLRKLFQSKEKQDKIILGIINPIAGSGYGKRRWDIITNEIKNIFHVKSYLTKCSGYTDEIDNVINENTDIMFFNRVLVVGGGDGMLSQILNGLLASHRRRLTDYMDNETALKQTLHFPIAVVPFGTGNGVATSLGIHNITDAVTTLLNNTIQKCDLIDVSIQSAPLSPSSSTASLDLSQSKRNDYSTQAILSVGWGAIADYDRLAEADYRWLGKTIKSLLIPVYIIAKANHYNGIFWYIDVEDNTRKGITFLHNIDYYQ